MYNIEIDERINQLISLFYVFRLWQNERKTTFRALGIKFLYLINHVMFVLSTALGSLQSSDINDAMFLVAVAISTGIIIFKLLYILLKKDEILSFLQAVCIHSVANHEKFIQINKKIKFLSNFTLIYVAMNLSVVTFFIIFDFPLFASETRLTFSIAFPWDWRTSRNAYYCAHAFTSIASILIVVFIQFTPIIWYLMMNCSIKYEILGNQFSNIGVIESSPTSAVQSTRTKAIKKLKTSGQQDLFLQELIDLIKTLTSIRETIDKLRDFFAYFFFAQIATSGLCICGSVYILAFSSNEDLMQIMVYIACLSYNIFDIFMVMHFGNEINLYSDRLSYCLFQSNWIDQSKSCKKVIIILCEILKQSHELVVFKLYPLNLETFSAILHLAYSMFNILQNFK